MQTKIFTQNNKLLTKNNKIITYPSFKAIPVNPGLTDYYKSGDYNIVGNNATQWNDSAGTNHMIQSNSLKQPWIYNNYKNGYSALSVNPWNSSYFMNFQNGNLNVKSMIMVLYKWSGGYNMYGSATGAAQQGYYMSQNYGNMDATIFSTDNSRGTANINCYQNGNLFTAGTSFPTPAFYILYTEFNSISYTGYNTFATLMGIDYTPTSLAWLELLCYNRRLTSGEIIYNTNQLNQKFNIF